VATILTVASQKGGVGKTTTAVNLAASLSLAGKHSLLVDLDPQGNASSGVGFPRDPTSGARAPPGLLQLTARGRPVEVAVRPTRFDRLALLPSGPELSELDLIQEIQATGLHRLRAQLLSLGSKHEFILIDCPPSLGGLPTIALAVSDGVLVPIQCEYYAMEGLSQILPVINKIQKEINPKFSIFGLLLTMFSEELDLSREVVREIVDYFPESVFRTIVPRDVVLAEAASHGLPAYHYAPLSRGAWSYVELAKEVLDHGRT
jgi:chromosome partitioning protein